MDWNTTIEQHRETLKRIVALLFALADLADRASGRSRRVRCEVLSILSVGETVAREFILEEAQISGMPILYLPAPIHDSGSAGDAVQLAAHLRALAFILAYIWAQTPSKRRSPRHFPLSALPRSGLAACPIRRVRRGVGFRALDSPQPSTGW